ncbi:unnamed protein product [Pieris brassicae]|uniref:Uncharacterized protein n=1 Tax=Pieris brassicae TaxID=7116 RepID=A0A9P0U0N3_PIEBR|nr:unnamed protein product [Pieris brassicae]
MLTMNVRVAAVYHLWKEKRRLQVHPHIAQRLLVGAFVTLLDQLRVDETKFFNYFRMSSRSFEELLVKLQDKLLVIFATELLSRLIFRLSVLGACVLRETVVITGLGSASESF